MSELHGPGFDDLRRTPITDFQVDYIEGLMSDAADDILRVIGKIGVSEFYSKCYLWAHQDVTSGIERLTSALDKRHPGEDLGTSVKRGLMVGYRFGARLGIRHFTYGRAQGEVIAVLANAISPITDSRVAAVVGQEYDITEYLHVDSRDTTRNKVGDLLGEGLHSLYRDEDDKKSDLFARSAIFMATSAVNILVSSEVSCQTPRERNGIRTDIFKLNFVGLDDIVRHFS